MKTRITIDTINGERRTRITYESDIYDASYQELLDIFHGLLKAFGYAIPEEDDE